MLSIVSLMPRLFPDLFSNENDSLRVAFNEKEVGHARFAKRVKRMLTTFVLRRRKCDVLGELVPKKDVVLKLKLTDSQQKTYDGIFNAWRQEMQSREAATSKGVKQGKGASAMAKKSMKNVFFSMRQAANHPLLVRSLVSDSQLEDLAKDLHKIGQFGTSCSREQVLKEISKYSDWDLHNCCLENKKRFAKCVIPCFFQMIVCGNDDRDLVRCFDLALRSDKLFTFFFWSMSFPLLWSLNPVVCACLPKKASKHRSPVCMLAEASANPSFSF